ncbi:MAG: hypothetical protein AAF329_27670 [Cyanobacteria bacterium P01_A01_bin.17]
MRSRPIPCWTRMALGEGSINAASFVTIRLASGAVMLLAITALTQRKKSLSSAKAAWTAALMLFLGLVQKCSI